uniref:COMM domain-containing protein n=1 Tax=Haptolina ericina TaxID=156174 RepID=A0A7S3F4N2_9EUKA
MRMKFALCGGVDVPDWLLSQIAVISKISAIKIRVSATDIVKQAQGEDVPYAKLSSEKQLGDPKLKLREEDVQAVVAALNFILTSAARHDVDAGTLGDELQQLGLPREHTDALVNAFSKGRAGMQARFFELSLRLPKLESLHWELHEDRGGAAAHAVGLRLGLKSQGSDASVPLNFRLTSEMLSMLRAELQGARDQMASVPA